MASKLLNCTDVHEIQKTVNDIIDDKQDVLVSGTNIKTINNTSILGDGNINISGGGGTATDVQINGTSITSNNVADIKTNSTYNASTNKIATMSDLSSCLKNTATGNHSLSVIGTATTGSYNTNIGEDSSSNGNGSTAIGYSAYANSGGTSLGEDSSSNGSGSIGLGASAVAVGSDAIQIGMGTNSTASTLQIKNYKMLDLATGLIPDARVSNNIARTSDLFSRNIGEIVQSTIPLSDAGLHLLDGSQIYEGGAYDDFYQYIKRFATVDDPLYSPDLFCTESDWQDSYTAYGVCGKFVYTPTLGNTTGSIRLPYLIGFIEGTNTLSETGDLTEAGLPNITGSVVSGCWSNSGISGCFYGKGDVSSASGTDNRRKALFDASRSSAIYGNSDTVQPQSIKVLYYIVVANSTKTEIEVDIDNVATDLNILNGELNRRSASYLTESYVNGTSGYRVYSDKWCVQWGTSTISNGNTGLEVTLTKSYSDTNFCVLVTHREGSYGTTGMCANVTAVNKIKIFYNTTAQRIMQWQTSGYLP